MTDKKAEKTRKPAAQKAAPEPVVSATTKSEPVADRLIRASYPRKMLACPECNAFPTVLKIKRGNYQLRRCRECGHRFEIGGD